MGLEWLDPPFASGHWVPDQIRRACEASLERLQTDRIDLYQLHWPDSTGVPLEETWEAMAGLVEEGLVGSIGVSNFPVPFIERCMAIRHVDSLQPNFSLLYLELRDAIRWCGDRGIGVVAYGPLAFGLLTGAIDKGTEFHPRDWRSGGGGMSYYDRLFAPGKIERSLAVAADHVDKALAALERTPPGPARDSLERLSHLVIERVPVLE